MCERWVQSTKPPVILAYDEAGIQVSAWVYGSNLDTEARTQRHVGDSPAHGHQ